VRSGPQPPPILDEASQASTTSSQAEDSSDTPKPNSKPPGLSHPPTPNTLGSPGAASMSSFHDEFESVSSPSWPRTPASPVSHPQSLHLFSKQNALNAPNFKYNSFLMHFLLIA
jgi:AT-rich interactive domain-containing protein 1